MKKNKIGRNHPCPCGSGKKFKKCCYGKTSVDKSSKLNELNMLLPLLSEINYGSPLLNDSFFISNRVHEISAPRLVYSNLLNPEVEQIASKLTSQLIDRGRKEAIAIEKAENTDELINLMRKGVDVLNHEMLKERLLQKKETTVPIILNELKKPQSSQFVEISIKILYLSEIDCSNEILEILHKTNLNAYTVSLICILLGFYGAEEYVEILWKYYHYFKDRYPNETFSDGPLIGLSEIWERKKESS
jgi:hypothetical protein